MGLNGGSKWDVDIFLASSKITAEEYTELMGLLPNKAADNPTEE